MSDISTHVLDTARGEPARGVKVTLQRVTDAGATTITETTTDPDGRARALLGGKSLVAGRYRLMFDTGSYLRARNDTAFLPSVTIDFEVLDATQHYHVPLLLSPFGYSTYRGS